ncbi:NNMT/PNMT/TEMT family protein [Cooperia oncophora]
MQMVLTCLPNIVARVGEVKRVLDFGAGPTIHVAASFRNQASEIYLADYLPQNRKELSRWCEGRSDFDWSVPLKMILTQEGNLWNDLDEMIALTRQKVRGVYHCDCFAKPSVDVPAELQGNFDVVVTIFCVEYCCKNYDEYKNAIKNIADQIRPGGFLVMGGILEETWCAFGGRVCSLAYT